MEFKNLGLAEPIVRAVAREGYTRPTPIQAMAVPHVLAGSDLLGCAQTGTGKTAAFALPIIHRLSETSRRPDVQTSKVRHGRQPAGDGRKPRALILAPTRELAAQIGESFRTYGRGLHLSHVTIFGGVNQNPQVRMLRAGVDIIIATPGRLMDLVQQRHIDLRAIEVLVLDEADRMLDMGFIPDIRRIIALLPKKRQTLLFSATMPHEIRALAASILHEPVSVQVDSVSSPVRTIAQSVYFVPRKNKPALLRAMLGGEASGRTLVFTRTKHGADKVVKELTKAGIRAAAIHGNKNQNARTRALDAFKSRSPPVLVATDIASRGIDVDDIAHVINFDLPVDAETYIHRIGRTARAGASGAAVSFCDADERSRLRAIERLTGETIAVRTDQPEHAVQAMEVAAGPAFRGERFGGGERNAPRRKSKSRSTPRPSSSAHKPPKAGSRQGKREGEAVGVASNGRSAAAKRRGVRQPARSGTRAGGGNGSGRSR